MNEIVGAITNTGKKMPMKISRKEIIWKTLM
jgi:hypothetical protein